MKSKTLITTSLSIIFTLVLTLVMVTVTATVAFADQTAEVIIESVNPKSTIAAQKTLEESVKDRSKKALREARKKDKPNNNSEFTIPIIGAVMKECTCDAGGGLIGIKASPSKCFCKDFCNPGRRCPL